MGGLLSLALVVVLALAPAARAEIFTIGPDLSANPVDDLVFCEGHCLLFQDEFGGPPPFQVRSPVNGTVIRWRVRNIGQSQSTVGDLTPRIVRRAGGDYGPVATGTTRTVGATGDDQVYEFPADLPIQTGDYFGVQGGSSGGGAPPLQNSTASMPVLQHIFTNPADNDPFAPPGFTEPDRILLVAADIEVPDPPPPPPPPSNPPAAPPPPDPPPLLLNFLRVEPIHFIPDFGAGASGLPGRVPPDEAATISYRLDRAARVTLTFTKLDRGFSVDGNCEPRTSALTRRLRREIAATLPDGLSERARRRALRAGLSALRCAIVTGVPGGTIVHDGQAGENLIPFDGFLGGRPLSPGVYTATGSAVAADGVTSDVTSRRFRILPAGVRLPRDLLTLARRGFVNQPIFCRTGNTGGCRGTLEFRTPLTPVRGARPAGTRARASTRLLGRVSFRIPQKRIRFVRVTLPESTQRIVRRHGRVRVTVRVRSRDDTGSAPALERRMPLRDIRTRP